MSRVKKELHLLKKVPTSIKNEFFYYFVDREGNVYKWFTKKEYWFHKKEWWNFSFTIEGKEGDCIIIKNCRYGIR